MSDKVSLHRSFQSLESAETFEAFSKVIINVSDDKQYVAGNDTGRTLEVTSLYGSQKVADDILARVRGYQYQPFTASGAILDPAAELGDGISADGLYSGIFSKKIAIDSLYTADVSAPGGEKINYAVPFKSKQERTIERNYRNLTTELKVQDGKISAEVTNRENAIKAVYTAISVESGRITSEVANREAAVAKLQSSITQEADKIKTEIADRQKEDAKLQSSITQQAGQIEARVSKTGGNSASFGWKLLPDSWTLTSKNKDVFKATAEGVEVSGKIIAKLGKIGGLDIKADCLSFNNMTWGGTNTTGIYIGTSGIQMGRNFRVDNAGNLYAASGSFEGTVKAGKIEYGGDNGTLDGRGLTPGSVGGGYGGAIKPGTITTNNFNPGINTSLGYAEFANSVFNGANWASSIHVYGAHVQRLYIGSSPGKDGYVVNPKTAVYKDENGVNRTLYYLAWSRV